MRWVLFVSALLLAAGGPSSAFERSPEGLEQKLDDLFQRYLMGSSEAKDFRIEELEANEYLRQQSPAGLPEGIESPWIRFEEEVAVAGAILDLEKVRASLPDSILFKLLSGRVPVEVTARLSGEKGVGKLDLERVLLAGVELPASLVATLAQGEGANQYLPPGFRLGEPFALPYDLETIRCRLGAVLVRQRPTVLDK